MSILVVFLNEKFMVVVLHTVLEKRVPAVMLKQAGVTQESTMQMFNGMFPISLMSALQETQVQSLLIVQLSKPMARDCKEVHMSSFETTWVSVGHEVSE